MSQIQKIELFHVEIPLPRPFYPSWIWGYKKTHQRLVLLRLTTDEGHEGLSGREVLGREHVGLGPWLAEHLLGRDPLRLKKVRQQLQELAWWGWNNHWIEPAFWDLRGKIEQKPVYRLLSEDLQSVEPIPVYCSTLRRMSLDRRLETLEDIQGRGFRGLKLRLHCDLEKDLKLVQHVRMYGGTDLALMLDADQGRRMWVGEQPPPLWKLPQALESLAALQELRIEWLEEPVDMHAYDDCVVLRSESEIPIAGGQMNAGWHEFKVFFDKGSLDIFQPDATWGGGVLTAAQVMDACLRRDLHFTPHSGHNGISMLINLHIYATWPYKFFYEFPYEPEVWTPEIRDALLREPLVPNADGTLDVPDEPGFGIHLNQEVMEKHATLLHSYTL